MKKSISLFAIALGITVSHAAISPVATRPALGGNDLLDWSVLGVNFTVIPTPFNVQTVNLMNVNVNANGGAIERRDQGPGWFGNFLPGDALAWTQGANGGPLTLNPATLIGAAGFNIQANFYGAFSAQVEAFDSSNLSLGTVSVNGNSDGNGDGSAVFLGFTSPSDDVDYFVISGLTASTSPQNFAINAVSFRTGLRVPDSGPGAWLTAGAFLALGVVGFRSRK